jgi:hypothetical protein
VFATEGVEEAKEFVAARVAAVVPMACLKKCRLSMMALL